MNFEITDVEFYTETNYTPNLELLALCNVTIDNFIKINEVSFCKSKKNGRYYLSFPSRHNLKTQKYKNVANPITKPAGNYILDRVCEEFNRWKNAATPNEETEKPLEVSPQVEEIPKEEIQKPFGNMENITKIEFFHSGSSLENYVTNVQIVYKDCFSFEGMNLNYSPEKNYWYIYFPRSKISFQYNFLCNLRKLCEFIVAEYQKQNQE